ncbi:phosphotyrosine protein, partial [Ramaria rubella]
TRALSSSTRPRTASEVFPRLFIADAHTARTPTILSTLGITHVLSILEAHVLFPPALALQTLHVHLADTPAADLLSQLPRTTAFIAAALQDTRARVLVHCWRGVSRSAGVVAGFLVATAGMTAEAAVALLKGKRSVVEPNSGFMRQLRQYE